jgi:hypothetical protein
LFARFGPHYVSALPVIITTMRKRLARSIGLRAGKLVAKPADGSTTLRKLAGKDDLS